MTDLIEPIAEAVADAKAFLRIGHDEEDAVVADLLQAAAGTCETFVGRMLVVRDVQETVRADGRWQRLAGAPVRSITAAARIGPDGAQTVLAPGDYAFDVDAAGEGWVKAVTGRPVRVTYEAGLGEAWAAVPDALRQGVLRLAAYLYLERGVEQAEPPASVAALWRPWRRMRL